MELNVLVTCECLVKIFKVASEKLHRTRSKSIGKKIGQAHGFYLFFITVYASIQGKCDQKKTYIYLYIVNRPQVNKRISYYNCVCNKHKITPKYTTMHITVMSQL